MDNFSFNVAQKLQEMRASKGQEATHISTIAYGKIKADNSNLFQLVVASPHEINVEKTGRHIFQDFNYTLIPVTGSYHSHGVFNGYHVASIVAERTPYMRRETRTDSMIEVRANVFLDQNIGKQWEKKVDDKGNDYFVSMNDVDIEGLLSNVTASTVSLTASIGNWDSKFGVGNTVKFCTVVRERPFMDVGQIRAMSEKGITVTGSNGATHVIPVGAVVAVVPVQASIEDDIFEIYNQTIPPTADGKQYGDLAKEEIGQE